MMKTAMFLGLIACSSRADKPGVRDDTHASGKLQPAARDAAVSGSIEHESRCGNVRAVWRGERSEGIEAYETLTIEIPASKAWTLSLEDIPRDAWSFDIFSPDCKHVLLLQSRLGPYHVVRTDRLAEYAAGGKPDYVLAGEPDPKGVTGTGNFHDGVWVSNSEVTYQWGCCDPPITTRFKLPK
jgi:hypothetical protein